LARKGKVYISYVAEVIMIPEGTFKHCWRLCALDSASKDSRPDGSLRGKGDLRVTNFSKTAVVAENILVPA